MNVVYSHIQFCFRMNDIFKLKVSLIKKLKETKRLLKHLVSHWIESGHLKCLNRGKWEQMVCPLGTWSFCARLGGDHAHARRSSGSGLGVGAGVQPGSVLFEPDHTDLMLQAGLDPLRYPLAALQLLERTAAAVPVWNEQLQQPLRLQRTDLPSKRFPLALFIALISVD